MASSSPQAAFADLPFYSAHFMDLAIWDPYVRQVALRHGYNVLRVSAGLPGTYPTFIAEISNPLNEPSQTAIVVKFFGPLFEGTAAFHVERSMGHFLSRHSLSIASPAVLADGQLDQSWNYLILERIAGVSFGKARPTLPGAVMEATARQLGQYLKELHTLTACQRPEVPETPYTWLEFMDFLENQRATCLHHHRQWNDLPTTLIEQLPGFVLPIDQLLDLSSLSHLIHADLTGDHLLGKLLPASHCLNSPDLPFERPQAITPISRTQVNGWESLAIIDWSDCRVGNILYELVAIHLDLFQGDKHMLHLFLNAYGLPGFYAQDFARKALCMVLLHQFPVPEKIIARYKSVRNLEELADGLFSL